MQEVLHARYYNIHMNKQKKYLIQMRSQAKTSGTILPQVHGVYKRVDPNIRPEKPIINHELHQYNHMFPLSQKISIMSKAKHITCLSDIIPTSLLKTHPEAFLPLITQLINLSLTSGTFPCI